MILRIRAIITHQRIISKKIDNIVKRPFLLLELMIALSLVGMCVLPLAQVPRRAIEENLKRAYRLQTQRLADLAFADIKEKLYKEEISWKEVSSSQKEKTIVFDQTAEISFLPLGKKTFLLKGTLHSVGKKGKDSEEYRLATFRLKITPQQKGLALFRNKKSNREVESRIYTYQILLSKPTAAVAAPELLDNIPIKGSG